MSVIYWKCKNVVMYVQRDREAEREKVRKRTYEGIVCRDDGVRYTAVACSANYIFYGKGRN